MSSAAGGIYTLVVGLDAPATIEAGALGSRAFDPGWYAYVGSALGPGGFARVDRHRELARGERDARHWHIDYLLDHPDAGIVEVVSSPGVDAECAVAGAIAGRAIDGFGASDCGCDSHLRFSPERSRLESSVRDAHESETA